MKTNTEKHAVKLGELAEKFVRVMVTAGDAYLNLCRYVRDNQVSPKLVRQILEERGLSPGVVGKINRLANTAPECVWLEYEARRIGFERALDMVRNPVRMSVAASLGCGVEKIDEYEATQKREREIDEAMDRDANPEAELEKWVNRILRITEQMPDRKYPVEYREHGYVLRIVRDKKFTNCEEN